MFCCFFTPLMSNHCNALTSWSLCRRTDFQMDNQTDDGTNGRRFGGYSDGQTDRRTNGQMDERIDRGTDWRTDGSLVQGLVCR